jgi:hypothetical protein
VLAFDALLLDTFWKEARRFSYAKYSSGTSVIAIVNANCKLCTSLCVYEEIRKVVVDMRRLF